MNKKLLLIIAAVVVLGGGGTAAYFLTKDDTSSDNNTNTSTNNNQNNTSGTAPEFNPLATNTASFVATMTGSASGQTYTATIESDGKGNTKTTSALGGQTAESYLINGEYIICNAGSCFKMGAPDNSSPVSQDEYNYTAEDFAAFKNTSTYKGKQSCPAGSCDTWEVSYQGYTSTMFVDGNHRISKVSGSAEGTSYEISYDYKDVTVTAPANVQTLPGM